MAPETDEPSTELTKCRSIHRIPRVLSGWVGLGTAASFIAAACYEYGLASWFGFNYLRIATISDYLASFVSGLPALALIVATSITLSALLFPRRATTSKRRLLIRRIAVSATLCTYTSFFLISPPLHFGLYICFVAFPIWILIGGRVLDSLHVPSHDRSIAHLSVMSMLVCLQFGAIAGMAITGEGSLTHQLFLAEQERPINGRLVRSYERGVIFWRPDVRYSELFPWDTIARIREVTRKDTAPVICSKTGYGCRPPAKPVSERER